MYLKQIKIKGFRLFQNLDLELNRGLNVLVGENDSGKTALVDAIRYTLGTNSSDRSYIAESDFFDGNDSFLIQLKFANVDKHAYRFVEHLSHEEYEEEGETKRRSVLHVQLMAQKTAAERRGYPYIKTELRSGIDGNGLSIETEIRSFLATTYLKPLRDAAAELSSGRASRLSQILSSSKDVRGDIEAILAIIAKANDDLLGDGGGLKTSAKNIEKHYLHKLIFEKDKQRLGANIDIAGVKSHRLAELPDNEKRRHLRTILEGLSLSLTEERRSHGLGYHNLLFMAAELLLLAQESGNELPLLLIEEPEAHLHPQLQMKLLQFIQGKVKTIDNPEGIQCILTTHSPNLSSKADPSAVIMLGGGGAWAMRPKETELGEDDYTYLRKFLDATKANVFFAKGLLFVEGDAENILLPQIARLLGRPLENYGVSIVKYDNSGSWKRFAKLFLRQGKDDESDEWPSTRVCVLRDLDLWPACAEEKADGSNLYGFLDKKAPGPGRRGNLEYWEKSEQELEAQIAERKAGLKLENGATLERQCVKVFVSDRWTFEFCLARYGLFEECFEALNGTKDGIDAVYGHADEKATYVQLDVSKTDFAYNLSKILAKQLTGKIEAAIEALEGDHEAREEAVETARFTFALALRSKLPPYIVEAIEYVTAPIGEAIQEGVGDAQPA
jgi:putative ATP-dependent endonuclease of the OLD family